MDRFVEDASLDDNVESFLSHDDADPRDVVGRSMDAAKGAIFLAFFLVIICYFMLNLRLKHALLGLLIV